MAVKKGTDLVITVDGTIIGHTTSCSLDSSVNMIDASTKDSAGEEELLAGRISHTISFSGLLDYTDNGTSAEGAYTLQDYLMARTQVTVIFGENTPTTGEITWSGSAYLDSNSISADDEAATTFSGSFRVTGGLTKITAA